MVGYHRETHHFREEKSTKELTVPQHTRFILPLTSPDKIHRCAAWAVFFFYGHLSGRRPLHLANARPFGRSKAPLGLLLLRKRELAYGRQSRLIMQTTKNRKFPTGNALLYISLLSVALIASFTSRAILNDLFAICNSRLLPTNQIVNYAGRVRPIQGRTLFLFCI